MAAHPPPLAAVSREIRKPTHDGVLSALGRAVFLTLALPSAPAFGQDGSLVEETLEHFLSLDRLTGQWGGARTSLEDIGLTFDLFYTADILSNVAGGIRHATEVPSNVDLLLTADMGPLAGWEGGTLTLYGLANHGNSISEAVGDLQAVSSIEAPPTAKLFEAWYEQTLFEERFSVLAGLYDVNSEFDVIPAASLFVHSAPGMGSELGASGKNGPSTFPVTSLAARVQTHPTDNVYFRFVAADGVPGDLGEVQRTQVDLDADDGLFLAGELGFYNLPAEELRGRIRFLKGEAAPEEKQYGYFGKYAIGVWGYTTEFEDFSQLDPGGQPREVTTSPGVYALAEQRVYYEEGAPLQGLSLFARVGVADDRASLFDRYVGGGVVYSGPIPGRHKDRLGLSVAAARIGDNLRSAANLAGIEASGWEVAYELTYRARVTRWLFIQPDVQYVTNPGGNPDVDDALVVGARVVVSF